MNTTNTEEYHPTEPEARAWAAQEAADVLRGTPGAIMGVTAPQAPLDAYQVILLADWIMYGYADAEVTEETVITVENDDTEETD